MADYFDKDLQDITAEIYAYKSMLKEQRDKLGKAGKEKAEGIRDYHKQRAIVMMQMKAGKKVILEGESIENSAITIIPAISKGVCYEELYKKELSESNYKSIVVQIECLQSEMNALQSIKRVQEVIAK